METAIIASPHTDHDFRELKAVREIAESTSMNSAELILAIRALVGLAINPTALLISIAVVFMTLMHSANAYDVDALSMSDILFPDERGWKSVNDFPSISGAELPQPLLDRMFGKEAGLAVENDALCSFRDRMMQEPHLKQYLHSGDVFAPGDDDLLYIGPNQCGEGYLTLLWRHVHDASKMTAVVLPRLLRIETGDQPRFTTLEAGCCAEVSDNYRIYRMKDSLHSIWVLKAMVIPKDAKSDKGGMTFGKPTVLRCYPQNGAVDQAIQDQLNDEGCADTGHTFGVGVRARILMTYINMAGQVWRLVLAPTKSPSSVGWVQG